jgi:hypothetical protein
MKKLPEVNHSFKNLYMMFIAQIKSKLLVTAIKLKVFDHLSEPRSPDAVTAGFGTLRLLLASLACSKEPYNPGYTAHFVCLDALALCKA